MHVARDQNLNSKLLGPVALVMVFALLWPAWAGCSRVNPFSSKSWHQKCGWKAEDYFSDPKVVALCKAIEANDLPEINRLVQAGADVNAQGKGKMTPLLWAFPDNKLPRFSRLLELGADPNMIIESDFHSHGAMSAGTSVTHMACETRFSGYFEAVFKYKGDPDLVKKTVALGKGDTPLFSVITNFSGNKKEHVRELIRRGVDLNHLNASGNTPAMVATSWFGQYELVLLLLEAGADHRVYQRGQVQRLAHVVIRCPSPHKDAPEDYKLKYRELIKWLEDHGEDFSEVRADIARWDSWSRTTGEFRIKLDAEIAARRAKELGQGEASK